MCKLCEMQKNMLKIQQKIENATKRHSIQIEEYCILLEEDRVKEAEELRMSIHAQTDIILDGGMNIVTLKYRFVKAINEGPGKIGH